MFMYLYYFVGSLVAFLCAVFISNFFILDILLYWLGLSLFLVAIAYLFKIPRIFRKKHDGSIPLYTQWAVIPYFAGVSIYNYHARKRDKVPAIQQVDDHLFLACRLFPSDIDLLEEKDITVILDVTAEFSGLDWAVDNDNLYYLNIPILDHQSPSQEALLEAIQWIENHLNNDRNIVVHCALGRGRSVFVVAAYLLSIHPHLSIDEVLSQIKAVRETVGLNRSQKKALKKLHQKGALQWRKRACLIANPVSGGGKWPDEKEYIIQSLSPYFLLDIVETSQDVSAKASTKQAKQKNIDVVIACGGDGTVTEVASELVGSDLALGIIPMGTTNALSHVLFGLGSKIFPIDLACQTLTEGKVKAIDTASCNDNLILLIAAIGFEQQMIAAADREQKDQSGQFAYLWGLWDAINKNELLNLTIKIDDQPVQHISTNSLVVANAAPFTTILAQGGGAPDFYDGYLDITWLHPKGTPAANVLSLAELFVSGLWDSPDNISSNSQHSIGKEVIINSDKKLNYVIDGENFKADKLHIVANPASLNVIMPVDIV